MEGLVSIIMPNYNGERFLEETIESVLAQTYPDWELLITDDCSTDGSVALIRRFAGKDSRIRLFVQEKNGGAAEARNRSLREAKGKWIAFLDSDDLWLPEKLERQISFMEEGGYLFSYTRYEHVDEETRPTGVTVVGPRTIGKRKMFRYCYPGCLTVMYDAATVGVLQIDPRIGNGENDYALWLKAVKKTKCYYLDECLARYRVRKVSLSHGKKMRLIKNHYYLLRYSEGRGRVVSFYYMMIHLFYGTLKKLFYVKRKRPDGENQKESEGEVPPK